MARKTNNRPQRKINPTIIGAGKTEKFYFHHLKEIYDLKIQVKPRYFGMALAYDRAKTSDEFTQSHTNIWKALETIGLPR